MKSAQDVANGVIKNTLKALHRWDHLVVGPERSKETNMLTLVQASRIVRDCIRVAVIKNLPYNKATRRLSVYISTLLVLSFVLAPLISSVMASRGEPRNSPGANSQSSLAPTPTPTPMPSSTPYDIAPSSGKQGKDYEVIVSSNQCLQDLSQDPPSTKPKNPLKDFELYAPDGSGIRVTNSTATECRMTAKLSLASDAPVSIVKLWLIDKKKRIPQVVIDFTVTGITAGPIPPGLNNKGQVDVMWSVLPDQVVHDNFGAKVATEYFCIDAVIGNDSGYDIQLASIGFTIPSLSAISPKGPQYKIPNTGYRVVRGTLQRRELLSPRSIILNSIKVAGPLLTGFTPFFHNMVHATNFSEFINIISNPLEKGFESAVPDTVPFQVDRLADQTFRDDNSTRTVIPNNIQTRVMTFVPKALLFPGPKGGRIRRLFKPSEAPELRGTSAAGIAVNELDRHNPQDVMLMLGDMVLIGEQIEHVNRIRVVSTGLETPAADRSISGRITDACNVGVGGVTMTLSSNADFTSRDITSSPDGTYTFTNVPIGRTYTVTPKLANMTFNSESPGSETFLLNDTKPNLSLRADYVVLTITGKVTAKDSQPVKDVTVSLTPTGLADDKKTNDAGVFTFELAASNLKIPTAAFQVTAKSDNYAFDTDTKTWKCNQREVTFVATAKPTPTPTPTPTP